jgi:TrmH family RNA methyltransferase
MLPLQIKSLQHSIVKHCVKLRENADYRKLQHSLLITGNKQILELPSDISLLNLFSLEGHAPIAPAHNHYYVSEPILKKISGLLNPEPYVAEVALPTLKVQKLESLLICDRVSDPGNLGTLLRTALSFNFDAVFLLKGCVDPFNDKSLRAAKGAIFHLPLLLGDWEDLLMLQKQYHLHLYQADIEGLSLLDQTIVSPFGLILGNESHGTSEKAKEHATSISIPISSSMDSLNVAIAGGVLMFNMSMLCRKLIIT